MIQRHDAVFDASDLPATAESILQLCEDNCWGVCNDDPDNEKKRTFIFDDGSFLIIECGQGGFVAP